MLVLLLQLFLLPIGNAVVITLRNETHIVCVSESKDLTTYLFPPIAEEPNKIENLIQDDNIWENWSLVDSTEIFQKPTTDRRWEDFKFVYGDHQYFELEKSLSFTVCRAKKLNFYLVNDNETIRGTLPSDNKSCIHYTLVPNKGTVNIFKDSVINRTININANLVNIRSDEEVYWKKHYYKLRAAYHSSENLPTKIPIPSSGKSYLILYALLCDKCYLEGIVRNGESATHFIINPNKNVPSILSSWQEHYININPEGRTELELYRKTYDSSSDSGSWIVDIRLYSSQPDMKTHRVNISEDNTKNHTCLALNEPEDYTASTPEVDSFCSEPGKLGNECNITCEEVLGSSFKYCEKHEICEGFVCTCAWGFRGPSCQESCKNETWGLSCQNTCDPKCISCDNRTGKCLDDNRKDDKILCDIIMILTAILIILLIAIPVCVLLWKKIQSHPTVPINIGDKDVVMFDPKVATNSNNEAMDITGSQLPLLENKNLN